MATAALLIHAPSRNKASNASRGKNRLILGISVFAASFQDCSGMVNPEVRYRVKVQIWTYWPHHRNHDANKRSPQKKYPNRDLTIALGIAPHECGFGQYMPAHGRLEAVLVGTCQRGHGRIQGIEPEKVPVSADGRTRTTVSSA